MLGTVYAQDLKITCIVGIYPKERELLQNLFLDVEFDLDFGDAENTEDVSHHRRLRRGLQPPRVMGPRGEILAH